MMTDKMINGHTHTHLSDLHKSHALCSQNWGLLSVPFLGVSWLLGLLGCPASLEQPPGWRHTVSLCKVQLAILISVFQSRPCSGNQLLFLQPCCPRFSPQHVFVSFLFFTSYLEFVFSVLCSCFHDGNDVIDLRSVLQHLEYLLSSYRSNMCINESTNPDWSTLYKQHLLRNCPTQVKGFLLCSVVLVQKTRWEGPSMNWGPRDSRYHMI